MTLCIDARGLLRNLRDRHHPRQPWLLIPPVAQRRSDLLLYRHVGEAHRAEQSQQCGSGARENRRIRSAPREAARPVTGVPDKETVNST